MPSMDFYHTISVWSISTCGSTFISWDSHEVFIKQEFLFCQPEDDNHSWDFQKRCEKVASNMLYPDSEATWSIRVVGINLLYVYIECGQTEGRLSFWFSSFRDENAMSGAYLVLVWQRQWCKTNINHSWTFENSCTSPQSAMDWLESVQVTLTCPENVWYYIYVLRCLDLGDLCFLYVRT